MWSLGYDTCMAISSDGFSCGLALFWSKSLAVSLHAYSSHIIDVVVNPVGGTAWRATFLYGEPKLELLHEFWNKMRFLKTQWDGSWICARDFNEVLVAKEHLGVTDRSEAQMVEFRERLDDCGLSDLGYSGPWFTWSNKQDGDRHIKVRLDRAVANNAFLELFEGCAVENIITTTSDHYVVHVLLNEVNDRTHPLPGEHSFKFEAAWLHAPD
jgi:hypothetical protein